MSSSSSSRRAGVAVAGAIAAIAAIQHFSDSPEPSQAADLLSQARAAQKAGKTDAAIELYERAAGITFTPDDVAVAATIVAGFFAARAGEPDIPVLPRLRWIQKLQLFPALDWLSDVLLIERPPLPKPFQA